MKKQIIVDSCCDMTQDMRNEMGIQSIPLSMMLGDKEFVDDEILDIDGFKSELRAYKGKTGSASPAPVRYQEAIENCEADSYIVTLSRKLSGSHNNAMLGSYDATENGCNPACVFDSKSASAGETLIAIKIYELIKSGMEKSKIIETINQFIDNMKTYFVFDNYDTLQKMVDLGKSQAR